MTMSEPLVFMRNNTRNDIVGFARIPYFVLMVSRADGECRTIPYI